MSEKIAEKIVAVTDEEVDRGQPELQIAEPTRYYVIVDLKHPIQYGEYKQSYVKIDIANHEFVNVTDDVLKVWTAEFYEYIPYSNVVKWRIVDRKPDAQG